MNTPLKLNMLPGLRPTPGLAEIESMMELFKSACLLVESRNRRILLANSQATELTAYTRGELSGMAFSKLIDQPNKHPFWESPSGQPFPTALTLLRRNGAKVSVQVTRHELAAQSKWAIIQLEESHVIEQRQSQQRRQSGMIQSMVTISQAIGLPDLSEAITMILEASHEITGCDNIGVYLQEMATKGQGFEMVRYAQHGADNILPERLPAQDLVHLRAPNYWIPGKRSASSLHRAARSAGLAFLASAPLGQDKAPVGFIAIAGGAPIAQNEILPPLEILANIIDVLIQIHTRTTNLEKSLGDNIRARALEKTSMDAIEDGIIVLTPTLNVVRLNPAAETILGYTNREARNRPVEDILIGTGALTTSLELALQGVPTIKQENPHLYRRSGTPFLAQVSIIPAHVEDHLEGIVVLIRDLSEQEQIQVQAEQLKQRAVLGEVSSIFAHEVRNPINNISTGLQVMAYNLSPDDPHQEVISRLQRDCERLDELMKSVLTIGRPAEYKLGPTDLSMLATRLVERFKPRMVNANIQPFLQIEPSLPLVNGNLLALDQVFINLINNAIEAMSEKGGTLALRLQTATDGDGKRFVEVNVADNGPGIPKEVQERLFQPFFTTKKDGNGLGLVITRRILNAHKGTITLTSYPGATIFHVQIPVLESP